MKFDPSHLARDSRHFWWNTDFLELMARRWRLPQQPSILDVGAGLGHWSFAISHVVPDAEFTLLDIQNCDHNRSSNDAMNAFRQSSKRYVSSAYTLPFPDSTFDVVTAQTLFIHLSDPDAVLQEMVRVLRPGGLVISCEPIDILNCARVDSQMLDEGPQALIDHFSFWAAFHAGRRKLGIGDLNIAVRIPQMMSDSGLLDTQAWQSDRITLLQPPYESSSKLSYIKDILEAPMVKDTVNDEMIRIALAGGADKERTRVYLMNSKRRAQDMAKRIFDSQLIQMLAPGMQIITARKGKENHEYQ